MHDIEQEAAFRHPAPTPAPSASSDAGEGRLNALLLGTGPQPIEGGPQKRKASPTQQGLPPPGARAGGAPLQRPKSSAPGAVPKGSQLGPGQPTPVTGRHHTFPGVRPGVLSPTQHVPGINPAFAPLLTAAEVQAKAAQAAAEITGGIVGSAGKGGGGKKGPGAGKGKGRGRSQGPQVPGPAGGAQAVPAKPGPASAKPAGA
eukprot:708884-Alexandrium_andersonii.AAC.1